MSKSISYSRRSSLPDSADLSQIRQTREILASIVENSDDAIISKRLDGTILSWNHGAENVFGYRANEMIGQSILLLIPPERVKEEKEIIRRLRHGERINHYETIRLRKDKRLIDVFISVSPLRDGAGRIIGASKIVRDITKRKQMKIDLHNSEQLVRTILETAADAIITINEHGAIQSANAATEQLFGYTSQEIIGQNMTRLMPEPFHGKHDAYLLNSVRSDGKKILGVGQEIIGLRKDGSPFPIHLAIGEVRSGGLRLLTGIVHDLSERRRMERQIMEAATNEQRRIGHDLHDGLCQELIGTAFLIDAVARYLPDKMADALGLLSNVAALVRDAARQARDLSHGLNPVDVRADGLLVALKNLSSKVSESFGVRCACHLDTAAQVSDGFCATHIYRIAQEAISNAIKHGKASRIKLSLALRDSSLVLSISDNGKGITREVRNNLRQGLALTARKGHPRSVAGIGFQTMQYRTRVIGGIFSATPRRGGGTVVTCAVRQEPHPVSRVTC